MRRTMVALLVALALPWGASALAAEKKSREATLAKKTETALDASLAGDITRKKAVKAAAPALDYDQFRLGVELQVTEKRHQQIQDLRKIISLSPADSKETPSLLFRLGELYWEESKTYFFEANRKDDDLIRALNANDKAAEARARQDKADLLKKSKEFGQLAMGQYTQIVQRYKDYERMDEVLYFLGHNLMDNGEDRKALVVYERLITKYPKSKYIPDAYLAFGEYFFNTSKGNHKLLNKALEAYKRAAAHPENQVYAFALYKEGWCYYNLSDFQKAMDMYKTVILFGELNGAKAVERDGGKSGKATLIREARKDYVRAYERVGSPLEAKADFSRIASKPDDLFAMMKGLANLYYDDGKDREAALMYNFLIKEKPLSPENPGFQGRIVDCVLRAGNKKMTVAQVRRLVKIIHDVDTSGVIKDDKSRRLLKDAKEMSERTLSNLAVNWHKEAKKTRDDETFALTNEVYSDYLTLFPDSPKAYDLRFFWAELLNDNLRNYQEAAKQYTRVLLQDIKRIEGEKNADGSWKVKPTKPGKYLVDAAYDAILAQDDVVKKLEEEGKLKGQASGIEKAKIPPEKQALIDACERYLKYVPKGDKRVEIQYKVANTYYRYNHFDEAVKRFADIALHHPGYKFENGDSAGELAANLILDSYNLTQNWAKVNEWARKFYAVPALAKGDFRVELSKLIEQSAFKLVNELEQKKEYAKAAEAYLEFIRDFPQTKIADKAVFNASVDYYKAHQVEKAIATRAMLVSKYPKSSFVPECIYTNAEAHEALGDFDKSADGYEAYVRGFTRGIAAAERDYRRAHHGRKRNARSAPPKSETDGLSWDGAKAQIALYNAGVFREGLGQFKAALRDREQFLELWPNAPDAEKVQLSIIDLQERMGKHFVAARLIEQYERDYMRDANRVLAGEDRLFKLFDKLHRNRDARRILDRAGKFYDKLGRSRRATLEAQALDVVARAQNLENEEQFRAFARMRLHWGRLPHPERDFKASLKEKARSLAEIQRIYTRTVKLKAADPAICALFQIGKAYENMASTLINAPMPRGAPPELQEALRQEMEKQAEPVKSKAADAFAAAVAKSRELAVRNDCSDQSLKLLRETYRPDQFPAMDEKVASMAVAQARYVSQGQGLLTQIVPARSADLSNADAPDHVIQKPKPNVASAPAVAPAAAPAANHQGALAPSAREDLNNDLPPPGGDADLAPTPPLQSAPAQPAAPTPSSDEPEDNL